MPPEPVSHRRVSESAAPAALAVPRTAVAPHTSAASAGRTTLAIGFFALVVGFLSYRALTYLDVPGQPQDEQWVMQDFRDVIYFPIRSMLDGHNPYDVEGHYRRYPVGQMFPAYSTMILTVHLPMGLMPYRLAELSQFVLNVGLTLVLAWFSLRVCGLHTSVAATLVVAGVILCTRAGHWNLLLGQPTLEVVIGCYLAFYFARRRPWLAAAGLALSTLKPNFGGPLVVLMLARGDVWPTVAGLVIAALVSAVAFLKLASTSGGIGPLVTSLFENFGHLGDAVGVDPVTTPTRVDLGALVARLTGTALTPGSELLVGIVLLVIAGIVLFRFKDDRSQIGELAAMAIAMPAVLLCTYHQTYDLLLLALPLLAAVTGRYPASLVPRTVLVLALAVPVFNYLAAFSIAHRLAAQPHWLLAVISINGVCLLAAFAMALTMRPRPHPA